MTEGCQETSDTSTALGISKQHCLKCVELRTGLWLALPERKTVYLVFQGAAPELTEELFLPSVRSGLSL